MNRIVDAFESVLVPYIGRAVAGLVLKGAAKGIDKDLDDVTITDVPALVTELKSLLGPVMSEDTVDEALDEATRRASL